jgi:hypothetical protein
MESRTQVSRKAFTRENVDRVDVGRVQPVPVSGGGEEPTPQLRHRRDPDSGDRELRRIAYSALLQGLVREALVVILREIWRGGSW